MRNKKHIQNEIIKLRKIMSLKSSNELQKDKAWAVMLTLQWALSNKNYPFGPANIVKPELFRHQRSAE